MQSFGFGGGPGVPASLDQAQAAAAAQYMAAGAAGYDMYKGRFQAVQGMWEAVLDTLCSMID